MKMSEQDLPDQYLYARQGPWPQPSPSHPLICADEVLHMPPIEDLLFNQTIGARYLEARIGYPPYAAMYAAAKAEWTGVSYKRFNEIMFTTLFTRFKTPLTKEEVEQCKNECPQFDFQVGHWWKYDFTAMDLLQPIEGTYTAPTKLFIQQEDGKSPQCICIKIGSGDKLLYVTPNDSSWDIASIYALQGASYHVLFVVHPALHFPMDSVNAITKTAVPMAHPLFQLFNPHSAYSLVLDNAVLESAESVVNNNAQGTRFDPLTANAFNLKLLFGAGYTGLQEPHYTNAYPRWNYMQPRMETSSGLADGIYYAERDLMPAPFDSDYAKWLGAYYERAFLPFCQAIAEHIRSRKELMRRVKPWARYCSTHVLGFPSEKEIQDKETLAQTMAIYIWNASVAHGGDHWSFSTQITPVEKCLRIRRKPPEQPNENRVRPGEIFTGDDLQRAALCQRMFFQTWAIKPNLNDTWYAFTDPALLGASKKFHEDLAAVSSNKSLRQFQPLTPDQVPADAVDDPEHPDPAQLYARTIPQSVQY